MSGTQIYENVMVIPAFDEAADLLRAPPPCGGQVLMILVINQTETASDHVTERNQHLASQIRRRYTFKWESRPELKNFKLYLFADSDNDRDILLVDRFSEGRHLPIKGGVGHARKIGSDLAAWLINNDCIRSRWIHCTDADVQLPETYFHASQSIGNTKGQYSALVYPYLHAGQSDNSEPEGVIHATELYEHSLRYYVAGLKFARSPYAFHTIGSTMAIDASHYAKVRGFPRREAGEDFYLLNKLAKTGKVLELESGTECAPIQIAARRSDRVPFGTGAAVIKIDNLDNPDKDYDFYHPMVFQLLKHWLEALPGIWAEGLPVLSANNLTYPPDESFKGSEHLLVEGLKTIGIEYALAHAFRQSNSQNQFLKQMHTWFDAFRTLKLIHYLRDHGLSSMNIGDLSANPIYKQILKT